LTEGFFSDNILMVYLVSFDESLITRSQCAVTMILLKILTPNHVHSKGSNLSIVKYSFNVAIEDNEFEHDEEHINWKEFIVDIIMQNRLFHCIILATNL
jgi:hypothetical protein